MKNLRIVVAGSALTGALVFSASAQTNLIQNSGPIGIGTTNPTAELEVAGSGGSASFRVGVSNNAANTDSQLRNSLAVVANDRNSVATSGAVAVDYYNDGNSPTWSGAYMSYSGSSMTGNDYGLTKANQGALVFQNVSAGVIASNGANIFISPLGNVNTTFLTNGNVGIGTSSPAEKLTIAGGSIALDTGRGLRIGGMDVLAADASTCYIRGQYIAFQNASTFATPLLIDNAGNVGIGTTSPTHKLEVNGTIRAKEVIVEATNWPDYVFAKDAPQPSLAAWQKSIETDGHLPGMPSKAAAEKDGVSVGEMQKALLEKVEQLSLIAMQQQRTIEALKKEVDALKKNEADEK